VRVSQVNRYVLPFVETETNDQRLLTSKSFPLHNKLFYHVMWVPVHHGTARLRVVEPGNGLRIWRIATIYWISSHEQPTRGGPPAWGLGGG